MEIRSKVENPFCIQIIGRMIYVPEEILSKEANFHYGIEIKKDFVPYRVYPTRMPIAGFCLQDDFLELCEQEENGKKHHWILDKGGNCLADYDYEVERGKVKQR